MKKKINQQTSKLGGSNPDIKEKWCQWILQNCSGTTKEKDVVKEKYIFPKMWRANDFLWRCI